MGFNAIFSPPIRPFPLTLTHSSPSPHPPTRPKDQHANPEWTPGSVPAAAQSDSRGEGDVRVGLQEEQRNFPWQGQPGAQGRGKWISRSVNGEFGTGRRCLFAKVALFAGELVEHKAAEDKCVFHQLFWILECIWQMVADRGPVSGVDGGHMTSLLGVKMACYVWTEERMEYFFTTNQRGKANITFKNFTRITANAIMSFMENTCKSQIYYRNHLKC